MFYAWNLLLVSYTKRINNRYQNHMRILPIIWLRSNTLILKTIIVNQTMSSENKPKNILIQNYFPRNVFNHFFFSNINIFLFNCRNKINISQP